MANQYSGDLVGTLLHERYQIQAQLGKRAGRRTLLALDRQSQAQVVVKLLTFSPDFEWDDLKLFEREAETLQSLSHPSIPHYLDHFEVDLTTYQGFALVQTYIDARSLEQHLIAGRSFSETDLRELAIALLEILVYLHSQHPPVIHRDIKPSNILLGDRSAHSVGQLYLVDFGSVQTVAAKEGGTLTVVGTYGYMPPEQFGSRTVPASDLYGLGATLIYLATGQHPADLPQRDFRIQFEDVAQLTPGFTRWLRQLVEPNLERRFTSAQSALDALHNPLSLRPSAPLASRRPPAHSNVQIQRSADALDIRIPPVGVTSSTGSSLLSTLVWIVFLVFWTGGVLKASLIFALFSIPFWIAGGSMVLRTLSSLLIHTHLRLTPEEMTLTYELPGGIKTFVRRHSKTEDLCKLVHTLPRHKIVWRRHGHRDIEVKPRILLWDGTRRYVLGVHLTDPEQEWLAQELSDWLGLPLLRE